MDVQAYTDLRYRVIITRGEGEDWPPLVLGKARYDVTSVSVAVTFENDGTLVADGVVQEAARRIRADGTPGHAKDSRDSYSGSWAGEAAPAIDAKAEELRVIALRMAGTAHIRLTGKTAPGGFRGTWMAAARARDLGLSPASEPVVFAGIDLLLRDDQAGDRNP